MPANAGIQVKLVSVNENRLDSVFTGMTKFNKAGYSIPVCTGTTVERKAHE